MDQDSLLLLIAERQQGYFTSRQAEECGFSRANFHRKIQSGRWTKELRGIYRFSNYPNTSRSELVLWSLWSADRKGNPQGIWSHETALEIHQLSDVSPKKLHMSVPHNFRKGTKIPNFLCLHFQEEVPPTDIEEHQGYRVTTPFRALVDIIQGETTQTEQIELAILDLAIQKSLIKGLATIQKMEQLKEITPSQEMREIIAKAIDNVWLRANQQLAEYGRIVEPYTVGLILENQGYGTAVLCQFKSQYFLLTATHVGKALRKSKCVRIALSFDTHRREYPLHSAKEFIVIEWDPSFDEKMLNDDPQLSQPKDLAIIIPTQPILDSLKIYKAFYKIPESPPSFSNQDALISLGGIESKKIDQSTIQLHVGPFAFVPSDYHQFSDVDYIVCPVSNHTYEMRNSRRAAIESFEGLSGSGLWKFSDNNPSLVGIAFQQDKSYTAGSRNVYFHGPQSIQSLLNQFEKTL